VAIMVAEARTGAYAAALMDLILHGEATDEAEQALWREMDVLAALRAHARVLIKDQLSS